LLNSTALSMGVNVIHDQTMCKRFFVTAKGAA
jgi:hypothetical protein